VDLTPRQAVRDALSVPPGQTQSAQHDAIVVRGAREHNLRDLDVRIPRDRLVVLTGPSGSGKSSLAFDTLYAEGQRRYVESLSAYARQFLDQMSRPAVESIDGLSPSIAIEQKSAGSNPRSTVGTITEILDYLRLLFSRAGEPHCPGCGRPIAGQGIAPMCERVMALPQGTRVEILAPVVRGRKGAWRKEIDQWRQKGYVRARIDGRNVELGEQIRLARHQRHDIDVVVDRLVVRERAGARLAESIATALQLADGLARVVVPEGQAEAGEWLLSRKSACIDCGISFPEIAPRMFSFNSPAGACAACEGLGVRRELDPARVVPDPTRALGEAIEPWLRRRHGRYYARLLSDLADHYGVETSTPWQQLPARAQRGILHGGREPVSFSVGERATRGGRPRQTRVARVWAGVLDELERREDETLDRYRDSRPCSDCQGSRLRPEARNVRLAGRAIHELCAMPLSDLAVFFDELRLEGSRREVGARVVGEIRDRLRFLLDVGLEYLSLDRPSATLSGGEAQRIRLATQIGSSMLGVLYILDEPSIGLHPRDNRRLLASLLELRDRGNSVLVVEHDEETIRSADWVIDMGPGAGIHGGAIVAAGSPAQLCENAASITGPWLAGRRRIELAASRRPGNGRAIVLEGCRANNLADLTFRLPLGLLCVVTGVSGSGKSTLVNDTLYRVLAARLYGALETAGEHRAIHGIEEIDKVIDVDQSPIGRSPRSNPATYSNAFGAIRSLFAQVPEARARGYAPGRFSFNVEGGRCEACKGDGSIRVEMNFLPDLFVPCEICRGRRYDRATLEILYKGRSIAEVLEMTVEEALVFMENVPAARRPLQALHDVGLDYIRLGQPATTLSGGEAQRIKLARELARRETGRTLYILDEPTTGLHFADVQKLLELLGALVDRGNTVVVIEHHLDVIKCADWIVDLGPEGGARGGRIVAEGTPESVARCADSHTGAALVPVLARVGATSRAR